MEALQYIYTSWKNGSSTEKGYMIYSRSEGISEAECVAIKDAMQYLSPKELSPAPTEQEIADVFPYAFAYFILPSGRGCVAQSTYLGRDYSGRFGNYIIYALVFDLYDLPCRPAELFAEPYIKTYMTEEELEAESPVPPLPPLQIDSFGSVINDDQLNEFIMEREEEFAQVVSMMIAAKERGVPFYLNDLRENLVLWSAAIQRILPFSLAKKFTFNTYIGDHESMRSQRVKEEGLFFHLIGVRPDANYFNYATESLSNRHLVMDFLGGNMSEGITPLRFAQEMAASMAFDMEEADEFALFAERVGIDEIDARLEDAFLYYQLLQHGEFDQSDETLQAVLSFGERYASEADNSEIGSKLLMQYAEQEWVMEPEQMARFWTFICKHADFMRFSLFDLLTETLYHHAGEAVAPCTDLEAMLEKIQAQTPSQYQEYLNHLNSAATVEQLLLYLEGNRNLQTNAFYLRWFLRAYRLPMGLEASQPISKILLALLDNLCNTYGSEKTMLEIMFLTTKEIALFRNVVQVLMERMMDDRGLERLCAEYANVANQYSDAENTRFEHLLMDTPKASPLVAMFSAKKISTSQEPAKEFWRFYDQHRRRFASDESLSIDPIVIACLDALDGSERADVAMEMIETLDVSLLRKPTAILMLTTTVNDCSIKMLSKLSQSTIKKALELRSTVEKDGLDKLKAVYFGHYMLSRSAKDNRENDVYQRLERIQLSLRSLSHGDYEYYTKLYFDAYFAMLETARDVAVFMDIFYCDKEFAGLVNDYINGLKKLKKKVAPRWTRLLVATCEYLVNSSTTSMPAEELYKPIVRYLRSLEEGELTDIKSRLMSCAPGSRSEFLFDEIHRKEGFSEKFAGFFHRK